jgi:hypothetical protein
MFNYLNSTGQGDLWWDYSAMFIDQCCNPADLFTAYCDPTTWNAECSYGLMDQLGIPLAVVQTCEATQMTELFDAEIALRQAQGIFRRPQMLINMSPYDGTLVCNDPLNSMTCGPLEAICSGFATGTAPNVCTGDISCQWGVFQDECAVCGGDGVNDACGVCLSPSNPSFGQSCLGCDGVIHSGLVLDPCGTCGGDGSFDACGKCWPANSGRRVDDPTASCDTGSGGDATVYVVFGLIIAVLLVGVFVYHKRSQRRLAQIDHVLSRYLPLDTANESRGGQDLGMGTSINMVETETI